MKRTLVTLVAAMVLLPVAQVNAQDRSVEGATPVPGSIPTTTETAPRDSPKETPADVKVAPPVNPLPSYYAMNKPRPPGAGDGGIAPPVNPVPAPTVDPSAFNTAPRSSGK